MISLEKIFIPGGVGSSSTGIGLPALCSLIACSNCLIILPYLRTLLGLSVIINQSIVYIVYVF